MTSLFSTQNYGDLLTGVRLQRLLKTISAADQPKIQPLLADNKPVTEEKYAITGLRVDDDESALLIRISGKSELLSRLAKSHLICLFFRHKHQLHQSDGLEVIKIQLQPDSLMIRTRLPQAMCRVHPREHFRVHLPNSMKIEAHITHNKRVYPGQLVDLSYGGCRIALPMQDGIKLNNPINKLLIRIIFPNGEGFNARAEKVSLLPNAEFSKTLLGCQFLHDSEEQSKHIRRYNQETEREVARISRSHQRQLTPSRLFESSPQPPVLLKQPDIQAPKNPHNLLQLADQLCGQVLLLQEKGHFSTEMLQRTSAQLLQLIQQDRDALYLALNQIQGIQPVILHHLQVAAWFYPLALKMGFSKHYQHALMASLIVHDAGRLLIDGSDPCLFLSDLPFAQRLEYKAALLRVVRATSKMHWIPSSLGESILVNANERLDGSGFPRQLPGKRQDSLTRALVVVKQLKCLTSSVAGANRLSWQAAYRQLKQQPEKFDSSMVELFIQLFGVYPVGSCITFELGYVGRVTRINREGEPIEVELLLNLHNPNENIKGDRVVSQNTKKLGQITGEYLFSTSAGVAA